MSKLGRPASPIENEMLKRLEQVLNKHEIDPICYSLNNGTWDDTVCLEKGRWFWNCFVVERGVEFEFESFPNLEYAGIHLIKKLSKSKAQMDAMCEEFKAELHKISK